MKPRGLTLGLVGKRSVDSRLDLGEGPTGPSSFLALVQQLLSRSRDYIPSEPGFRALLDNDGTRGVRFERAVAGCPACGVWKALRRIPSAYVVEEFGDFLVVDVAQQEVVSHQVGDHHVLLALLAGARVLRVTFREPPQVL